MGPRQSPHMSALSKSLEVEEAEGEEGIMRSSKEVISRELMMPSSSVVSVAEHVHYQHILNVVVENSNTDVQSHTLGSTDRQRQSQTRDGMSPRTVVVTGCTGYVATQVVKQLLEKGYSVRGTVRSTSSDKVKILNALSEALPGSLTLHQADLLKEGSFDAVVKGASVVFHVASPFLQGVEDAQTQLVDPAVKARTHTRADRCSVWLLPPCICLYTRHW